MKIHIRYFASLREITELGEETLELPDEASVTTVRTELIARYPRLQPIMQRCISAVNRRYVDVKTTLQDGDELVFIPPMGGGDSEEEEGQMKPLIQLTWEALDRTALVAAVSDPAVGGIVVFE